LHVCSGVWRVCACVCGGGVVSACDVCVRVRVGCAWCECVWGGVGVRVRGACECVCLWGVHACVCVRACVWCVCVCVCVCVCTGDQTQDLVYADAHILPLSYSLGPKMHRFLIAPFEVFWQVHHSP
jgi:hypothetical protein